MASPKCTILAGPSGADLDLLRMALRRNVDALRRTGVDAGAGTEGAVMDAHRLLILNSPAEPQLTKLAKTPIALATQAVIYVDPPHAALLARTERALLACKPLERQFRKPRALGYVAALARYGRALGDENVEIRISSPVQLSGASIFEDFWHAADLPGYSSILDLASLRPLQPLSLEAALTLNRLITHHANHINPAQNRRIASTAITNIRRLSGRPLALPRDYVADVLEASRRDIDWLTERVGPAAMAEPRPQYAEPAWAMDGDTLDSLATLIIRAARQSEELRVLRKRLQLQVGSVA